MLMSVVIALLLSLNLFHVAGKIYLQATVSIKNLESKKVRDKTSTCKVGVREYNGYDIMTCEGDGSEGYTKLQFERTKFKIPIMTPHETSDHTQGNEVFTFQEGDQQLDNIYLLTVDGYALRYHETDGHMRFIRVDLEMHIKDLWKPDKKMTKKVEGQDYAINAYEKYIETGMLLSLLQYEEEKEYEMVVINPKAQIEGQKATHYVASQQGNQSLPLGAWKFIEVVEPEHSISPPVFGMKSSGTISTKFTAIKA